VETDKFSHFDTEQTMSTTEHVSSSVQSKSNTRAKNSEPGSSHAYKWHALGITSLGRQTFLIAICLFLSELFIMFTLDYFPVPSPSFVPFIDAGLLLFFLIILYLVIFRPTWNRQVQYASEVSHLSRKLMHLVEEERLRISTDLHDHFGQTLSTIQLNLERLRRGTPATDVQQMETVTSVIKDISNLSDDLRKIVYELRPVMLESFGLVSSISDLIREFTKAHPQIFVNQDLSLSESSLLGPKGNIGISLYRICQELLNNIAKHSDAKNIVICLRESNGSIIFTVEDDGKGFVVRRIHGGKRGGTPGIGLFGINERVRELGGTFTLLTEPGKGTVAKIELPVQQFMVRKR
jgi:glucose-6-phosphate-specific signal transduction histidine kinase